jgi:hypothetical protein
VSVSPAKLDEMHEAFIVDNLKKALVHVRIAGEEMDSGARASQCQLIYDLLEEVIAMKGDRAHD